MSDGVAWRRRRLKSRFVGEFRSIAAVVPSARIVVPTGGRIPGRLDLRLALGREALCHAIGDADRGGPMVHAPGGSPRAWWRHKPERIVDRAGRSQAAGIRGPEDL